MRCPTCQAPEPRLHPAVSGEGEVTRLCPDPYHGEPDPRVAAVLGYLVDVAGVDDPHASCDAAHEGCLDRSPIPWRGAGGELA
jgi:hypothetical protein